MPKRMMLSMLKSSLLGEISSQDSAAAADAADGLAATVAGTESAMVHGCSCSLWLEL